MILRRIAAVIAGVVLAVMLVQAAELLVHQLYPPPPGYDMSDMNAVKKFVAALPVAAMVLVLTGWLFGTFAGTFFAARIGRSAVPAYVVGAILVAGGVASTVMIPQPAWFSVVSFVIFISMTIIGARVGRPAVPSTNG